MDLIELSVTGIEIIAHAVPAFIGVVVGHVSLRYYRYMDAHKERIEIANNFVINFSQALEQLIVVKKLYHGVTDDPLDRMVNVQHIVCIPSPIDLDCSRLSFLVSEGNEDYKKYPWLNLTRIQAMAVVYNQLIGLFEIRNNEEKYIFPKLAAKHWDSSTGFVKVNWAEIKECVGEVEIISFININEQIITILDGLILEVDYFVSSFYKSAMETCDMYRLENHVKLNNYNTLNKDALKLRPEVNYVILAQLFKESEAILRSRYSNSYLTTVYPESEEETLDATAINIEKVKNKERLRRKFKSWL